VDVVPQNVNAPVHGTDRCSAPDRGYNTGMASEIEAKVRVTDAAALGQALESAGAEYCGAWIETDAFFDHPDERLRKHDTALRLRLRRPADPTAHALVAQAGEPGGSALLTYKGPRRKSHLKVREEHQVSVPDSEAMADVLGGLGYRRTFCYDKRRRIWRLAGSEVTLDEIPVIGTFCEVEAADEASVDRLLDALGFAGARRLTDSYLGMLVREFGGRAAGRHVTLDGRDVSADD